MTPTKTIGLIGNGNASWIAGIQYLHSLLYGNSLLPPNEQLDYQLYLHQDIHRPIDFEAVVPYLQKEYFFDFFPGKSLSFFRKGHQLVKQLRDGQRLHYPVDNLNQQLNKNHVDLVFPANDVVLDRPAYKQISWIPDFQHVHLPEYFTAYQRYRRNMDFKRAIVRSDRVIVSNQGSYQDAVRLYPAYAAKFKVLNFTMFLGENWREPDVAVYRDKYQLPEKYLMFPSQFWKHKNHLRLFEALALARARGHTDLTIVCTGYPIDPRHPRYENEIQSFLDQKQLRQSVRILGLLPRFDQVQLMRGAAAIVQPSLFEGWSALLEDCHSLGKSVIASDIPMHQEQRTDRTIFFAPHSPENIAECLVSQWTQLRSGPDPEAEEAAAILYYERIRRFARQFTTICQSTL